jgi:NitT/TauT family transport system ATP-binding protein
LEALQLLDFAQVADGDARLTPHGQAFLDADIQRRKMIFGEHLLRRVPLAGHICRVIDERPNQRAPESRFLRELEDSLSEDEAERVLQVIVDWGRYAELFAYDYTAGVFSAEKSGRGAGGRVIPVMGKIVAGPQAQSPRVAQIPSVRAAPRARNRLSFTKN